MHATAAKGRIMPDPLVRDGRRYEALAQTGRGYTLFQLADVGHKVQGLEGLLQ